MQADPARVERAITGVKDGDPAALNYLYTRYADGVRAYVESIVGGRAEADEITKGTFLKLPDALPAYETGGLPFEGWLLRMARSAADEQPAAMYAATPDSHGVMERRR
jgi:DNA-directed RNA polymerase specialized sigma24 family protein